MIGFASITGMLVATLSVSLGAVKLVISGADHEENTVELIILGTDHLENTVKLAIFGAVTGKTR